MKVIVDTCVWSLALRRQKVDQNDPYVYELHQLIGEVRVQLIGPIRQEILSGISSQKQFDQLKENLSAFPDLLLESNVYEMAAYYYNINRKKGLQGSNTDFLICAVSNIFNMPILTFDKDFPQFRKHIPLDLLQPRS